jgi:Fe2+ or Zn2+ uptake regulation protein
MSENASILKGDTIDSAERHAGRQPALTGCPWHDVNEMLQSAGLRPTRQRMALGWLLFGKGARHLTAEMLYEEATLAKVPVSLATVYNTLNQLTDAGLLRQVSVDGTTSIWKTITSWSTFRIRIWCCRRCRRCRRVTRSPASTWSSGCARSAEFYPVDYGCLVVMAGLVAARTKFKCLARGLNR